MTFRWRDSKRNKSRQTILKPMVITETKK